MILTGIVAEDEGRCETSEDELLEESQFSLAIPSLESARKKRLSLVQERQASISLTDLDAWPFLSNR